MIEIHGLVKNYGSRIVLDHLDLQVGRAECVAITGANGAGKTTLLRILAGITGFNSGEVLLDGFSLKDEPIKTRSITGLVSHQPLLYGDLTAEENLLFYSGINGVSEPKPKIDSFLNEFHLEKNRKQFVRTFSRGMQQRLTIIRALLPDPKVLLLDEPLSSLDQETLGIMFELFTKLKADGKTILMATHDLEPVESVITRKVLLQNGTLTDLEGKVQVSSSILIAGGNG